MPARPEQPGNRENVEREARAWTEASVGTFETAAKRFDERSWEMLMAPEEGGGQRRLRIIESRLNNVITGWISEMARTTAGGIEERERVKEETLQALHRLLENSSASLMRLAAMQTVGEDPERTHARYLMLVENFVEGMRNINPRDIVRTIQSRGAIATILGKLQSTVNPQHRLSTRDYVTLTEFITGLRTDRNREAGTDPARLLDQSIAGALLTSMSQDEFKTLCQTFHSQGNEGQETGRFLLLFAVQRGYRSKEMAGSIARVTRLENQDFSRLLENAETSRQQMAAALEDPEIRSIMQPFLGSVVSHTMSLKHYVGTTTVMYLGGITCALNVLGRIIEHYTESSGKPWNEQLMAVLSGVGAAATDPYAWLGAAAAGWGANELSEGRMFAGFANAPSGALRERQERTDKHARLWDEFHARAALDDYILKYFTDFNISAREQQQATHISRPRNEDIPDLKEDELRTWGFRSQDSAKDFLAQAFQTIRDDFGKESEQDFRMFFEELHSIPRPTRLDIPTTSHETT